MSKSVNVAAILSLTLFAAPLTAQDRSTVSTSALQTAIAKSPSVTQKGLQTFIATDRVAATIKSIGLKQSDVEARVAKMDQAALTAFAQQTKLDDRELVGGRDTIVISATALIIALLILILITD